MYVISFLFVSPSYMRLYLRVAFLAICFLAVSWRPLFDKVRLLWVDSHGMDPVKTPDDPRLDPVMMVDGKRADKLLQEDSPWTHFYIAANFNTNEKVLPFFIDQLCVLIRTALLPAVGYDPSRIFVSIFESNSVDETVGILEGVLRQRLEALGVPHRLVTNGVAKDCPDLRSNATPCETRIHYLGCYRNEAMRPLHEKRTSLFGNDAADHTPPLSSSIAVIFFNDIYFRASDMIRLLTVNGGDVDLSCGLDYYTAFYDVWVTRDVAGRPIDDRPPYSSDPSVQRAFLLGKPMKATCCWNGVAIIRGSVFLDASSLDKTPASYMFRGKRDNNECGASECQYLCQHMHDQGWNKIFIHPRVVLAYELPFFIFHRLLTYVYPIAFRLQIIEAQLVEYYRAIIFYSPGGMHELGWTLNLSGMYCMTARS